MPDSTTDSEPTPPTNEAAAALSEALRDRVIADAEFLAAVEAYRETGTKRPGLYEGLARQIQQDTELVKRLLVSDRTDVSLPDFDLECPDEWDAIPTTFDYPSNSNNDRPFRP